MKACCENCEGQNMDMIERLPLVGQPGQVRMYRDDQTPRMTTWAGIPNDMATVAALSKIHIVPSNGTTVTKVNPLDPYYDNNDTDWGTVIPAGKF